MENLTNYAQKLKIFNVCIGCFIFGKLTTILSTLTPLRSLWFMTFCDEKAGGRGIPSFNFGDRIYATVNLPIQNMKTIDGKPEYKGAIDVLTKVIRNEGFFSLWKGFTPYFARLGPHTVLTFIFLEQMTTAYHKYVLGNKETGGSL